MQNQIEKETLERLIAKNKGNMDDFFNAKGTSFKALGLKDKLPLLSDDEKMTLLLSDGKLIKRPLFEFETMVLFGFNEALLLQALSK